LFDLCNISERAKTKKMSLEFQAIMEKEETNKGSYWHVLFSISSLDYMPVCAFIIIIIHLFAINKYPRSEKPGYAYT